MVVGLGDHIKERFVSPMQHFEEIIRWTSIKSFSSSTIFYNAGESHVNVDKCDNKISPKSQICAEIESQ